MERDKFDRKDYDPSVWCKCRNCSTKKTEKECLCCQEVEGVRRGFGIFVLSQEIILSELQKQSRRGVLRNFAMNYLKFLRISFLTEHLRWLLLELTHNLMTLSPFAFVTRVGFRTPAIRSKLQKTHRKTPVLESLLIWDYRNSSEGVFLWILRNFYKHLFCRTSRNDCFWNVYIISLLKIILRNLRGNSSIHCFIFINTFVVFI